MIHQPIDKCALKIIAIVLVSALILSFLSCKTSKHITTSVVTVDSSYLKEKIDSVHVLLEEKSRLESTIKELQYAGVVFDSSKCPPSQFVIDKNCNVDSILRILDEYKNTVKIYADGTIEAQGKLKSAYYTKNKLTQTISELTNTIDSLRKMKQTKSIAYKTTIATVDKEVKRSFFSQWWMWLIVFVAGCYIDRRSLSKIKLFKLKK